VIAFQNFFNIFSITELRRKLFFTLGVLAVYRLGNIIPIVGVDVDAFVHYMSSKSSMVGGIFSYIDMFSGGSLGRCTLFSLGIGPYITASIVMQFLTISIPTLEELAKEGEYGRKIINQYTRYLTLAIAVLHSIGYAVFVERSGYALTPGWGFRLSFILLVTVGAMFTMWLGEQISLHGLGNGSSMLIFAGIVARFPNDLVITAVSLQSGFIGIGTVLMLVAIVIGITSCIVYLEKGERKIPVQYTRRVVGNRVFGGQGAFIPFRINNAGVMPVIYSQALINFPMFITSFFATKWLFFRSVTEALQPGAVLYNVIDDFILIIAFSFIFLTIQFNPVELAENMRKSGGFIPGIRPGRKTADFFNYLLIRIGLVGAIYLAGLAILPNILVALFSLPRLSILSGTGLLIIVGVALELAAQMEAYLLENRYKGFLTVGRFKARGARQ
jgi:preprotein translocase subunit SecY